MDEPPLPFFMSVSGLCMVCEAAEARYSCESCGAVVCVEHYDQATGLCVRCARAGGGHRL